MKPQPNSEIDLLLRQLSRRNGVPVSEPDEQHLDADELNSYVANALPPAARARYTEHVADCASCRKLVAQLSAAQGPVTVSETPSVVAPSGWKSFLASFFSPMVLRYAVPALGLIVIGVVGIVVMRRNQSDWVAQLNNSPSQSAAVNQPEQAPAASPQGYYDSDSSVATKTVEAERARVGEVAKTQVPATAAQVPAEKAAAASGAAAEPPPAPKVAAPVVQNEPAPPADDLSKQKKEQPKAQTETVQVQAGAADTIKRDYDKAADVTVTPGSRVRNDIAIRKAGEGAGNVQSMGRGQAARPPAAKATGTAESKEREEAAETRSVAGRRFRKSAGVWIDTEYDSSKSITGVARGSEQYRALVADEPTIRTIAEALEGQIVLVWKGHTYRIR